MNFYVFCGGEHPEEETTEVHKESDSESETEGGSWDGDMWVPDFGSNGP